MRPDLLSSPLAKGEALLHRGGHGSGQLGGVIAQGIIPAGHGGLYAHLQIPQPAERADHTPTDLLYHRCHIGIAGWLDREKAGFALLVGAIEIDTFKANHVEMQIEIKGTSETLDKCD